MNSKSTVADSIRGVPMWILWIGTFVIVAFIMGILNPERILEMVLDQGLGDEETSILMIIAWLTIPLTIGITAITWSWITGWHESLDWDGLTKLGAALLLLLGLGLLVPMFGLGLQAPDFVNAPRIGGNLIIMLASIVIGGYLSAYGILLMASSIIIGVTLAIQIERVLNDGKNAIFGS